MKRFIQICCPAMTTAILARAILPAGKIRGQEQDGCDDLQIQFCPFCGEQAKFMVVNESEIQ